MGKVQKPHFDIYEYVGKRSNLLTVVGIAERKPNDRQWKIHCLCDCGKTIDITPSQFNRGIVKSCGCLRSSFYNKNSGHSKHPLYHIWLQMMYRCYNPKSKHYNRYGGRGIKVCAEWHDFFEFVRWSDSVGGKTKGYSLDRVNNDGNYEPSNCRWATQKQQVRNQSRNIIVEYNGVSKCLADWAEDLGIKWVTLHNRYVRGWSVERMLTEPIHKK